MSVYEQTEESYGLGTSSCPAMGVAAVYVEMANGASNVAISSQLAVLSNTAAATSAIAFIDSYATLSSTANATNAMFIDIDANASAVSAAHAQSAVYASLDQLATSMANATSGVPIAEAFQLLSSVANAMSTVPSASAVANVLLESRADAKSQIASQGLAESVVSSGNATSLIAIIKREVSADVSSTAAAGSTAFPSTVPATYLVTSTAAATSLVQIQTDAVLVIEAAADAASEAWYRDPSSKAWVMNTETTAVSWYDSFGFESMASWRGVDLAVGPDGIYELVGDTDNGQEIDAVVKSGFDDFGDPHVKRVDNAYFGYTSDGTIAVTVETYESGHPPYVYQLEQRSADAPRNSRITPGKGLWGRYWRMTVRNVDGADFEVHDASVDIATSSRRI